MILRQRYAVLIGLLMWVLVPCVSIVVADNADNNVTQAVVPAVGRPGTTFAFFATGFQSHEEVVYWFNAPDGNTVGNPLAFRVDSYAGRADWRWTAPYDTLPGTWHVVAYGKTSHTQQLLSFVIENPGATEMTSQVVPAAPPVSNPADVAVQPVAAPPDTRFYFFALGFAPGETVHFWANDPQHENHGSDTGYSVVANPEGRADWHWKAHSNALFGLWTMVAWGEESHIERIIFFTITNPELPQHTAPTYQLEYAVEPMTGTLNTLFSFYATGFVPHETVVYYVVNPHGRHYTEGNDDSNTNANGRADWQWHVVPDAAPGAWLMVAEGTQSHVIRHIPFAIAATNSEQFNQRDQRDQHDQRNGLLP